MKKIDVSQMIMMLANFGVIVGIVFLSFEIRQNTTQMRAEAALGVLEQINQKLEAQYADEAFTELVMRGEQDYLSLEPIDQRRVEQYFFSQLNLIDLVSALAEEGLSDISIKIVDIYVAEFQSMPGRRQFITSTIGRADDFSGSGLRSEALYRKFFP